MIIYALIANAAAHVISFIRLNQVKAPSRMGVLAFVFINAAIALLFWQNISWAKWPALVFPAIGGLGLLLSTIIRGKGTLIDYIIFLLDVVIVFLVLKNYLL